MVCYLPCGSMCTSHCPCRCKELSEQVAGYKQELNGVNEQLLIAVQQKFKLQQQNEEWQVIEKLTCLAIGVRNLYMYIIKT